MTATPSAERSRIMRSVKSTNTGPELLLRKLLHKQGYRYRLHRADLPGKPDLTFPSRRAVIFVHGCFWHGHNCPRGDRVPKTNRDYWVAKIARNRARDQDRVVRLRGLRWRVLTVWECELRKTATGLRKVARFLDRSN
ncbi:MAG: very short patch repair endonuclease [Gemmatimonadaceae bacterium]